MKKVIFSAILMMVSVVAVAQQREGSLSIVPKVGLTLATVTDDDCGTKGGLRYSRDKYKQDTQDEIENSLE